MKFVFPEFLWALFSLAIPIIIHLLNLQKTRVVFFSNLQFLKEVKSETNRKFKLKRYLVLLARLLFLFFLVIAFCQPYFPVEGGQNSDKGIAFYVDNSLSMSVRNGNSSAYDKAVLMTEKVLEKQNKNAKYQLISNIKNEGANSLLDYNYTKERLAQLSLSSKTKSSELITNGINNSIDKMYYLSDFQNNTFNPKDFSDTLKNYVLVHTNSINESNVFVDSIWINEPYLKKGQSYTIFCKLKNVGTQKRNVSVSLLVDKNLENKQSIEVFPNGSIVAKFNYIPSSKGMKACEFELGDKPVTFDNRFFFDLVVNPSIKVTVIKSEERVYSELALTRESVFDLSVYNHSNIDYSKSLSSDLIILEQVKDLSSPIIQLCHDVLNKGGDVLVFPSQSTQQETTARFNQIFGKSILSIANPIADTVKAGEWPLATPDIANPFYNSVFKKVETNMDLPTASPRVNLVGAGQTLLKWKNKKPFLRRYKIKKGQLYVCASPLTDQYTNFHKHSLFLPVIYKISELSKKNDGDLYNILNKGTLLVKGDFADQKAEDFVLKNDGVELKTVSSGSDYLMFQMPEELFNPGNFRLMNKSKFIRFVSVNLNKNESDISKYSIEELRTQFKGRKNVSVIDLAGDMNEVIAKINNLDLPTPLWKICLILSLLFLLIEITLIRLLK